MNQAGPRDNGLRVDLVSGVPVVVAPEEIDISNAASLRMALLEAATRRHTTLVIDMSRTQFCDSTGLNVLVRAYQRARSEGIQLLLVTTAEAVLRVLAVTGVAGMIPSLATLEEALAKAQGAATEAPPPGAG